MVQRASPGSAWNPPNATDWNSIGEATEITLRHHRTGDQERIKQLLVELNVIHLRNDTGADRREGDVLEAGTYLLDEVDPRYPWFTGLAPSSPVRDSTHGVLRYALEEDSIGDVQISGRVKAWVNVTDDDHNFCDAEADEYAFKSNNRGPHKIIYKPSGTGELECWVLLYADSHDEILAEAYALTSICPEDQGGSGTGSEGQEVLVHEFRILPYRTLIEPPPLVTNPRNHRGPPGSLLTMTKMVNADGDDEWRIIDIEIRPLCTVNGIDKQVYSGTGLEGEVGWYKFGSVIVGSEWCPTDEPTEACELFKYGPCESPLPVGVLTWEVLVSNCCNEDSGTGTGTGGTG